MPRIRVISQKAPEVKKQSSSQAYFSAAGSFVKRVRMGRLYERQVPRSAEEFLRLLQAASAIRGMSSAGKGRHVRFWAHGLFRICLRHIAGIWGGILLFLEKNRIWWSGSWSRLF